MIQRFSLKQGYGLLVVVVLTFAFLGSNWFITHNCSLINPCEPDSFMRSLYLSIFSSVVIALIAMGSLLFLLYKKATRKLVTKEQIIFVAINFLCLIICSIALSRSLF